MGRSMDEQQKHRQQKRDMLDVTDNGGQEEKKRHGPTMLNNYCNCLLSLPSLAWRDEGQPFTIFLLDQVQYINKSFISAGRNKHCSTRLVLTQENSPQPQSDSW